MTGLTEKQRNDLANKIMNKIVEGGVWINLHKLNTKFEGVIIEIRES